MVPGWAIADTPKPDSTEVFLSGIEGQADSLADLRAVGRSRNGSLERFAEQRRAFLLNHVEIRRAIRPATPNRRSVTSMVRTR